MAGTWNLKKIHIYIYIFIYIYSWNYFEYCSTFVSSFKESQSIEQDEVGNNTQDTASENQDIFEETPRVSASQTSTEKKCCCTFIWFLIGKEKASARLIWSYIRPASSKPESSASHGRRRIWRFWQISGPWIKKLPLNLAVQCQNDLHATLSRYRSRAICESSLSPASTCDSGATETSLHCYDFLQQSQQTSANIPAQRENVGDENFTFSYWETFANNYNVHISCM